MRIVVLGIDLGKNLCSLAGLDETGAVVCECALQGALCATPPDGCGIG